MRPSGLRMTSMTLGSSSQAAIAGLNAVRSMRGVSVTRRPPTEILANLIWCPHSTRWTPIARSAALLLISRWPSST
jgi:hypothetical protein